MGLLKSMTAPNGVPLEYHRITNINILTNEQNIIFVSSYISKDQRDKEKENLQINQERSRILMESTEREKDLDLPELIEIPIYAEGSMFSHPYDQYMTIDSAYEYLKTLPEFEDAEDC